VEIDQEQTEQTEAPVMPRRPARRLAFAWLAGALSAAAAALGLIIVGSGDAKVMQAKDETATLEAAAQFIGTTLDGEAHATMVRAEAIASSSMLRAAIETDAQTLADMARDQDVTFPIKGTETIEVYQQREGGRRVSLLRLPMGTAAVAPPAVGKTQLAELGSNLVVIANAAVTKRGGSIGGQIVLAVPVDVEPIRKKLAVQSSLVGLGPAIVLVAGNGSGARVKVPIDTEAHAQLSLEAVVAQPLAANGGSSRSLRIGRYAFLGLAGLLFAGFGVALRRR
jgi:hypothetical protein